MNVKTILRDNHGLDLLDAQVLLAHVLNVSRADLYSFDDRELTESEYHRWIELYARRLAGEPVVFLVGEKEYFRDVVCGDARCVDSETRYGVFD